MNPKLINLEKLDAKEYYEKPSAKGKNDKSPKKKNESVKKCLEYQIPKNKNKIFKTQKIL